MKRNLIYIGIGITVLFAASLAMAKDKKGPMTGTWDCQAHGGSQGDMAFTLFLQQNKETVDGSISSPIGGTQISSGTFKRNMLEIHLDTPQGATSSWPSSTRARSPEPGQATMTKESGRARSRRRVLALSSPPRHFA